MNKTVKIEGMMCKNCAAHVRKAFEDLKQNVEVVLEEKKAVLTDTSLTDEEITNAVENCGYEVVGIE